ncbi:hypothetical protein S83_047947, partial [Arachis hypogaea]
SSPGVSIILFLFSAQHLIVSFILSIPLLSSRRSSSASERWRGSQRVNIVICAGVLRLPLHRSTSSVPMDPQPR